jgi:hypothetical protein
MYYVIALIVAAVIFYFYKGGNFFLISRNLIRTYKSLRSCQPPFHKNQSELLFITGYVNGLAYFNENEPMQRKLFLIAQSLPDSLDELQTLRRYVRSMIIEYMIVDSGPPRNNQISIQEAINSTSTKIDKAILNELKSNKLRKIHYGVVTEALQIFNRFKGQEQTSTETKQSKPETKSEPETKSDDNGLTRPVPKSTPEVEVPVRTNNKEEDFILKVDNDSVASKRAGELFRDITTVKEICDHVFRSKFPPLATEGSSMSPGLTYLWPTECLILSLGFITVTEKERDSSFINSTVYKMLRNEIVKIVYQLRQKYYSSILGPIPSQEELQDEILKDIAAILIAVRRYANYLQTMHKYPEVAFSYYLSGKIDPHDHREDLIDDLMGESFSQARAFLQMPVT